MIGEDPRLRARDGLTFGPLLFIWTSRRLDRGSSVRWAGATRRLGNARSRRSRSERWRWGSSWRWREAPGDTSTSISQELGSIRVLLLKYLHTYIYILLCFYFFSITLSQDFQKWKNVGIHRGDSDPSNYLRQKSPNLGYFKYLIAFCRWDFS